MVTESKLTKRR